MFWVDAVGLTEEVWFNNALNAALSVFQDVKVMTVKFRKVHL